MEVVCQNEADKMHCLNLSQTTDTPPLSVTDLRRSPLTKRLYFDISNNFTILFKPLQKCKNLLLQQ